MNHLTLIWLSLITAILVTIALLIVVMNIDDTVPVHADNMFQAREVMRRCSLSDKYPEIETIWNLPEGEPGRHPIGYKVICSE